MNKEICSYEIDRYNDGLKIIGYEDETFSVDEICESGNRSVVYNDKETGRESVHEVKPYQHMSINTNIYFQYIKGGNLPAFQSSKDKAHDLHFIVGGKEISFLMSFITDTIMMDLNDTIMIMSSAIEDPYDIDNKISSFISAVDDVLFIIDYEQMEFYTLDNNYNRRLYGKIDRKGNIIDYLYNGERYKLSYDNHSVLTDYKRPGRHIEEPRKYERLVGSDTVRSLYSVPYVITTKGVVLSTEENKLFRMDLFENNGYYTHTIHSYRSFDRNTYSAIEREFALFNSQLT